MTEILEAKLRQPGPLVPRIKAELAALLRRDGFASLGDAVGTGDAGGG